MDINFYNVDLKYIEYVKKFEKENRGFTRVPNVNYHSNNNKFFYGAVLTINGMNYFVPVSSKTNAKQDDMIIKGKDNYKYGTLRFAYMLPIPRECLILLIRDKIDNRIQAEKIRKELAFCRKNIDKIFKQAKITYERITQKVNKDLVHNSCDFKLLEQAYIEYCKGHNLEMPKSIISEAEKIDPFSEEIKRIEKWVDFASEKADQREKEFYRNNDKNER